MHSGDALVYLWNPFRQRERPDQFTLREVLVSAAPSDDDHGPAKLLSLLAVHT